MLNLILYVSAIASLIIGFFLTWLCVLSFVLPIIFFKYIFGNDWDVLAFYWAFSTGLLAFGYALLFLKDDFNRTRLTYVYTVKLAKANLVYTLLTNFVGLAVILTKAYSISFAYTYPVAYATIWVVVVLAFYIIVNSTKKPPLKKKVK